MKPATTTAKIIALITLTAFITLINTTPTNAETISCGEVVPTTGAGAAKSPSQYFEVSVPASFGMSEEDIRKSAEEKLTREITVAQDKYSTPKAASLSQKYEDMRFVLQPPMNPTVNSSAQGMSKATEYITACEEGTTNWFYIESQGIEGQISKDFTLADKATQPLNDYLIHLPLSPTRVEEVNSSQGAAAHYFLDQPDSGIPKMSLILRPRIEDTDSYNVYWDLCVTPPNPYDASNRVSCPFEEFVTELSTSTGDTQSIVPGAYTSFDGSIVNWGNSQSAMCVSSETLKLSPFKVAKGQGVSVTAKIFGRPSEAKRDTCVDNAAEVTANAFASIDGVTKSEHSQAATKVMCPGVYTPAGRIFKPEDHCIAGVCKIDPAIHTVQSITGNLWAWLQSALSNCNSVAECIAKILVQDTRKYYVYFYNAGGNYGAINSSATNTGVQSGFNQLFRPPQDEFSSIFAEEPAGDNNHLSHNTPIKSDYTKVQTYLTPPGQSFLTDKSEML